MKSRAELQADLDAFEAKKKADQEKNKKKTRNRREEKKAQGYLYPSIGEIHKDTWAIFLDLKEGFIKKLDINVLSHGNALEMLMSDYMNLKQENQGLKEGVITTEEPDPGMIDIVNRHAEETKKLQEENETLKRECQCLKNAAPAAPAEVAEIEKLKEENERLKKASSVEKSLRPSAEEVQRLKAALTIANKKVEYYQRELKKIQAENQEETQTDGWERMNLEDTAESEGLSQQEVNDEIEKVLKGQRQEPKADLSQEDNQENGLETNGTVKDWSQKILEKLKNQKPYQPWNE